MSSNQLPVAVIGAGPVGLAAAAHLAARGIEPVVFEAGETVGASVREWGPRPRVLAVIPNRIVPGWISDRDGAGAAPLPAVATPSRWPPPPLLAPEAVGPSCRPAARSLAVTVRA
jgi:putative NAD(P)-binding protein